MALTTYSKVRKNLSDRERIASSLGGAALALYGIRKKSLFGGALAVLGTYLVQRGATGRCMLYRQLGINTANKTLPPSASVGHGEGIKVEKAITIYNKRPEELYRFWRNLENLPRFMSHLESVTVTGPLRSHWVAKGPAGQIVEWDAEIHNEIQNELLAWRTVGDSQVNHAGSVEFKPTHDGSGTEIKVVINYDAPTGRFGAAIAKIFGEEPSQQLDDDLRRLKMLMEAGEVATTEGQPLGKAARILTKSTG